MDKSVLQFQPLQSVVDVTFWSELGDLKLHTLKLEEGPLPISAYYSVNNHPEFPGFLTVEAASLEQAVGSEEGEVQGQGGSSASCRAGQVAVLGDLYCLNTVEQLVKFDRKAAVQKVANEVWAAIVSGEAEQHPHLLQRLVLLTYCDLKHYKYYYWFAFPALQPPAAFTASPAVTLADHFSSAAEQVLAVCADYSSSHPGHPCWLLSVSGEGASSDRNAAAAALLLSEWKAAAARQQAAGSGGQEEPCLVVADCGNLAGNPGWPLRNALLMAAARWGPQTVTVVCLRERRGRPDPQASIVLQVVLPEVPQGYCPEAVGGWEANARGKQGPRMADLGPSMDPHRLAAAAVDLNLRLMRWRAAPSLQVDAIGSQRCLLLGAGTLGCSVARTLLGWGVRHVTFVDSGRVAYSNPVRQSLYTFEDCLAGGKPKAEAAAEAVQRIFPGVVSRGVALSIPMPGHPIAAGEAEKVAQDIATLTELVSQHDVIFLLTDTRESRWLPTLLAAAAGKLAITSALGFDGFMVMRHGAGPDPLPDAAPAAAAAAAAGAAAAGAAAAGADTLVDIPVQATAAEVQPAAGSGGNPAGSAGVAAAAAEAAAAGQQQRRPAASGPRLGCYFCQDVVAPANSTVDRTLDQQCTVARPGLSSIAGALAAELMAATVAHPLGAAAPAAGLPAPAGGAGEAREGSEHREAPLGEVPHMIRGQLGGFSQMCLAGQAFRQCTACSEAVVSKYREEGAAFLLKGLADPCYLEDLTGLTELHKASEAALEGWGSEEEEEDETAGSGGKAEGSEEEEEAWEEI